MPMILNVQHLSAPTRVVLEFDSRAGRDEWLTTNVPERKAGSTPGFYRIPRGSIGVFCYTVTLYGSATALAPRAGDASLADYLAASPLRAFQ